MVECANAWYVTRTARKGTLLEHIETQNMFPLPITGHLKQQ